MRSDQEDYSKNGDILWKEAKADEFAVVPIKLDWRLPEYEQHLVLSNTDIRKQWLTKSWREAEPYLEMGYNLDEVINAAGVEEAKLVRSLKTSFTRRLVAKTARSLLDLTGYGDESNDPWLTRYKAKLQEHNINPYQKSRDRYRIALKTAWEMYKSAPQPAQKEASRTVTGGETVVFYERTAPVQSKPKKSGRFLESYRHLQREHRTHRLKLEAALIGLSMVVTAMASTFVTESIYRMSPEAYKSFSHAILKLLGY